MTERCHHGSRLVARLLLYTTASDYGLPAEVTESDASDDRMNGRCFLADRHSNALWMMTIMAMTSVGR
jgi:hypothetical protein